MYTEKTFLDKLREDKSLIDKAVEDIIGKGDYPHLKNEKALLKSVLVALVESGTSGSVLKVSNCLSSELPEVLKIKMDALKKARKAFGQVVTNPLSEYTRARLSVLAKIDMILLVEKVAEKRKLISGKHSSSEGEKKTPLISDKAIDRMVSAGFLLVNVAIVAGIVKAVSLAVGRKNG